MKILSKPPNNNVIYCTLPVFRRRSCASFFFRICFLIHQIILKITHFLSLYDYAFFFTVSIGTAMVVTRTGLLTYCIYHSSSFVMWWHDGTSVLCNKEKVLCASLKLSSEKDIAFLLGALSSLCTC